MAKLIPITTNVSQAQSEREIVGQTLEERVRSVLDLIRPAVQADGGDIELVSIKPDKTVVIRLHGACVGCPSSAVTLRTGIERNLKVHIPEIKGIEAVD